MMENLAPIAQLMKGRNPEKAVMELIKKQPIEDPMIVDLIKFAQSGDQQSFNNLASSIFKANGLDMNDELSAFMELMK